MRTKFSSEKSILRRSDTTSMKEAGLIKEDF